MPCLTIFILLFEFLSLSFLFCIDVISLFLQYIMAVSFSSHLRLMRRVVDDGLIPSSPFSSILLSFVRIASSRYFNLTTRNDHDPFFLASSILPHKRDVSIGKKGSNQICH